MANTGRKRDFYDTANIVLLFVAFVAAAFAAIFTGKQASVATQQLDEARGTAKLQLRAYVGIVPANVKPIEAFFESGKPSAHILIKNTGQTIGRDLVLTTASISILPRNLTTLPTTNCVERRGGSVPILPNVDVSQWIECEQTFTPAERSEVDIGTSVRLYVFGSATYKDIYEEPHGFDFCFYFDGIGIRSARWEYCNQHNQAPN